MSDSGVASESHSDPPFVLSQALELRILVVVGTAPSLDKRVPANGAGSTCETVTAALEGTSEPRLPTGEIAREELDAFDLLWLDPTVARSAVGPGLVALLAAAHASNLPIYSTPFLVPITIDVPIYQEETLADAIGAFRNTNAPRTPRGTLARLQRHYARMAAIRGYDTKHPQDTLLLLTEEMGELAHALRDRLKIQRGHLKRDLEVQEELADMQLYILHLANITKTSLGQAVVEKEELNHARWIATNPTVLGEATPRYLAVEGLIGCGKTTAAALVAEYLRVQPTLERVDDHPFLTRFYDNPERYALEVELAFILMRWHALRDRIHSTTVVADYSPFKDLVFSGILLHGYDLDIVRHLYDHFWQRAPQPTLTVFLDVSPMVALERIKARGRPFEQGIDLPYLESLRNSYNDNFAHLGQTVVRLVVDEDATREDVAQHVIDIARKYGFE